jgi:hypothetical protein
MYAIVPRNGLTPEQSAEIMAAKPVVVIYRGGGCAELAGLAAYSAPWGCVAGPPGVERLGRRQIGGFTYTESDDAAEADIAALVFAHRADQWPNGILDCFGVFPLGEMPPRPPPVLLIRGVALTPGVILSKSLDKQLDSPTQHGRYYLGRIADPMTLFGQIDGPAESVQLARRQVASLVAYKSAPEELAPIAHRYADCMRRIDELDRIIADTRLRCGRTRAEIGDGPKKCTRPATPRPTGDLAAMKAELAAAQAELATPTPVYYPVNAARLAELETLVPSTAGLPAELAAEVRKHINQKLSDELAGLRAARDANAGIRERLGRRTMMEGRVASLRAYIDHWQHAAQWSQYDQYKAWAKANPNVSAELALAEASEAAAVELAKLLRQRSVAVRECWLVAQSYGAMTGQASVLEPPVLLSQLKEAMARLADAERKLAEAVAARRAASAQYVDAIAKLTTEFPGQDSATRRAVSALALAEIMGAAPCLVLKRIAVPALTARLLRYFPLIICKEDGPIVNYAAEVAAAPVFANCACGGKVKITGMAKHLVSKAHRDNIH